MLNLLNQKARLLKKANGLPLSSFSSDLQHLDSVNVIHSCTLIENITNDVHSLAVRLNLNILLQKKTSLEVTLEYEKFKKSKKRLKTFNLCHI